ncbi:MAG: hypothetical protein M3R36_11605 [Bacteroidota bacterium]|nr:hypothetical protein [Bacteroidota bacterium]
MSSKSKKEYFYEIQDRYQKSDKEEKQKILDEFCNVCCYNRKYAIRILNEKPSLGNKSEKKRAGPKKIYHTEGIKKFIKTIWIKTNLICPERLKDCIPFWLPWYKKKITQLSNKDEVLLRSISASTIGRILKQNRSRYNKRGLCTTRPGSLIRQLIPIKTDQWNEKRPGFVEIDLVAHCGTSVSGEYINTLNAVDIATGWTSQRAVWGKGEVNTFKALRE